MRALALPLIAVLLVAVVLGTQVAAGGGDYVPQRPADPCAPRAIPTLPAQLEPVSERIVLLGLDSAACRLGISRERLVLALADPRSLDPDAPAALKAGLRSAVDRLDREGRLPKVSQLLPEALEEADLPGFVKTVIAAIPDGTVDSVLPTAPLLRRAIDELDVEELVRELDDPAAARRRPSAQRSSRPRATRSSTVSGPEVGGQRRAERIRSVSVARRGKYATTTFVRTRRRRSRTRAPGGVAARRSRTRPARLTRMSPVRIVWNGPAPVRRFAGSVTAALTRPAFGTRSSSDPRPPLQAVRVQEPDPPPRSAGRVLVEVLVELVARLEVLEPVVLPVQAQAAAVGILGFVAEPVLVHVGLDKSVEQQLDAGASIHPTRLTRQ